MPIINRSLFSLVKHWLRIYTAWNYHSNPHGAYERAEEMLRVAG